MLGKEERMANYAKQLPYNFSWVELARLAGTSIPSTVAQLEGLVREGVSHLVSLSPEMPPPATPVQGLTIHYIPIEDFQAPTLNQIEKFLEICDDALEAGKGVAVHCRGGNGRTGTMLAAFLIRQQQLDAETAVDEVRRMRPGAVESWVQEQALANFHRKLFAKRNGGG
jgi:atypical dual specificity phosphatase